MLVRRLTLKKVYLKSTSFCYSVFRNGKFLRCPPKDVVPFDYKGIDQAKTTEERAKLINDSLLVSMDHMLKQSGRGSGAEGEGESGKNSKQVFNHNQLQLLKTELQDPQKRLQYANSISRAYETSKNHLSSKVEQGEKLSRGTVENVHSAAALAAAADYHSKVGKMEDSKKKQDEAIDKYTQSLKKRDNRGDIPKKGLVDEPIEVSKQRQRLGIEKESLHKPSILKQQGRGVANASGVFESATQRTYGAKMQETLNIVLQRENKDDRLKRLFVSNVYVEKDLRNVRVKWQPVTPMKTSDMNTLNASLGKISPFLATRVGKILQLKTLPLFKFYFDVPVTKENAEKNPKVATKLKKAETLQKVTGRKIDPEEVFDDYGDDLDDGDDDDDDFEKKPPSKSTKNKPVKK